MARVILELTNLCNLRCLHCFDERHAATGEVTLELLDKILAEGKGCGIDSVCLSGGEPTIHPQFAEIVRRISAAGYRFSFVSNAVNFGKVYPLVLAHRAALDVVTFSLDGASEETHDKIRGKGSYRRVLRAASICVFKDIPFTLNMCVTAKNRSEVAAVVELGAQLGSRNVRFGHLMFTPETVGKGLNLSPQERRDLEAEVKQLQQSAKVPVVMAAGHYSESPFFACTPLRLQEYNIDYKGNFTLCCHLSGFSGANSGSEVMGNLRELSLAEAVGRLKQRVATYNADKRERVASGRFSELDHFPCWYCVKYLGKVSPDKHYGAWSHDLAATEERNANPTAESTSAP